MKANLPPPLINARALPVLAHWAQTVQHLGLLARLLKFAHELRRNSYKS